MIDEHEPQSLETEPCRAPSEPPARPRLGMVRLGAPLGGPITFPASDHFARKADKGKPNYALLPPEAWAMRLTPAEREGVVRVLEFGALKYAPHSWADVPDALERYRAAAQRHREAMARGETLDQESGLPHRDHFLCCVIFVFALECRKTTAIVLATPTDYGDPR